MSHADPIPTILPVARPLPIWPAFVTFAAAFVALIGVQIAAIALAATWLLVTGVDPTRLAEPLMGLLPEPVFFCGIIVATEVAVGLAAIVAGIFSSEPLRVALGLVAPKLSALDYLTIPVGT